ncbi:hypothetical protein [Pseudomonas schmalbachii]|uniref:ER-bound oxygenase mpaB/mpaB'/Rubber oxygenase catalytic domain-containing protein n=1 Tax=Pseudomonas schmalbachii TaxID=2816993 RepID=A0ABS3TQ29_9PSED|nr:hypothetical protein [Pseudomonas schmalbachii]MBO3275762.1 hypothetical protein [Pseudomonas schmalbachii]
MLSKNTPSIETTKFINKKVNNLKKEFTEWLAHPNSKKLFLDDGKEEFGLYLKGEDNINLMGLASSEISHWHLMTYSHLALTGSSLDYQALALIARHTYASTMFDAELINKKKMTSGLLTTEASFNLSIAIISGWGKEFRALVRALHAGLDTKLLDLRITPKHDKGTLYRHFWFLVHLACEVEELTIDTSLYSYPKSLAPYDEVLADWKTTDLGKVSQMVQRMADFHAQHSREDSRGREVYEFENEERWLFPYEIFAFLRLREWLGLKNPHEFDHPLMQQPLGCLPCEPGIPLARPETPLLDQVIAKFNQQYPNSIPWPKD